MVHRLVGADVIADRTVRKVVVAVLRAERQLRGHEEQFAEGMDILHARGEGQVVRRAVGVEVLLAAVITLAGRVLERGVGIEAVAAVGRRDVERKASAVDGVVGLARRRRLRGGRAGFSRSPPRRYSSMWWYCAVMRE